MPAQRRVFTSLSRHAERDHVEGLGKTELGKMRANGIGDVARRQMRVMFFSHPRIAMAELRRDDPHRNATHRQQRSMRVSQNMEGRGRGDLRPFGGFGETPLLMRCAPTVSI